jgi:hypothetical protein
MHSEEQREIGHNSLVGIAVAVIAIGVIAAGFWLLR